LKKRNIKSEFKISTISKKEKIKIRKKGEKREKNPGKNQENRN